MSRAKTGTRMSNISILNKSVDSTWIENHYDGILDTSFFDTGGDLQNESGVTIQNESGVDIAIDVNTGESIEVTTISFVGDERPTPDATTGEFKAA